MFIDGEYWGLYTLQEDYDDHYYENNYDVNSDEVIVYKKGEIDEGLETDIEYFRELRSFAENNDLSVQSNYDKICGMIDVQSFIDYMSVEMYIINEDWPGNNYSLWRTRTVDPSNPYADGRWRFNLYDTEMGVDHYGNSSTKYNRNNLSNIMKNNKDDMPVIFNALLKNEGFKAQFINTFMDLTAKNFDPDTVREKEKPFYNAYYPELSKSFARFPNWANTSNATNPCIDRMRYFFDNRPSYVPKMLAKALSLPDAVNVNITTVNPAGGSIRLNTIDVDTSKTFSGNYFPGTDITITAAPAEGYSFVGWRGSYSSNDLSITVSPEKAVALQAVFVRNGDEKSLCKVTFTDGSKSVELYTVKGGSVAFPAEVFKREGYTASADKSATNVTSDMTVNVKYTGIKYTVRFISNGSKESSYEQQFTYGTEAALTPVKFKRAGWSFRGWAAKSNAAAPDYTDKQKVKNLASTEGTVITLYAVWSKPITSCEITGINSSYVYGGKVIRPEPVVTADGTVLRKGTDYTVGYSDGTKCGKHTVTVYGKGKYTGKKVIDYKIVPGKVKVTKVSRGKTAVKLTWSKVQGAEKYRIYRKVGGKYKTLATVKGTSYKNTKLKAGTVYRYKVAAIGGGVVGAKTAIATATKTAAPKLTAKTAGKGKVKLSWGKVAKASGYRIYMSTKKSSGFKAVKTLSAKKTAYTKSGLKSGKTYYFKIRTYKTVDGKKLLNGYSKVVKVKAQ